MKWMVMYEWWGGKLDDCGHLLYAKDIIFMRPIFRNKCVNFNNFMGGIRWVQGNVAFKWCGRNTNINGTAIGH